MSKVFIRPINVDDTNNIVKWRNSSFVRKNLYNQDVLTKEQHIIYYETYVKTRKCTQFIIVVEDEDIKRDIGTVFIKNIDYRNRCGEYGIFIGEIEACGRGYAQEATKQILDYGFNVLNLHRIFLTVMSDNYPAIAVYKKSGFIYEGKKREEYLRSDGYVDVIIMSVLEQEWEKVPCYE